MENNNHSPCFSVEELMAYLYGEVSEAELGRLDRHLADCRTCTDDFAAVSESRFSVYEWQRADFAELPTPMITGPWSEVPLTVHAPLAPGKTIGDRLRSLIPSFPKLAFTFGAIALAVVGVWIGFVNLLPSGDRTVAHETQANLPVPTDQPAVKRSSLDPEPDIAAAKPLPSEKGGDHDISLPNVQAHRSDRQPSASRVAVNHVPGSRHPNFADMNGKRQEVASSFRRVPNLSGIEEDEDRTVRLSDLFAEVGADNENN